MAITTIRLRFETEREAAFGAIVAGYTGVGAAFANPIRLIVLQNQTDVSLTFSFDGVNDTITIPSNVGFTFDISSNKDSPGDALFLSAGDRIFVKRDGVPTSGSVFVTAFYGG